MANNCLDNNLHNNSGTSQGQRLLEALSAGYAKVDERSTADLLLFAKKYGTYLNYYDTGNTSTGDWSGFMSQDISVIIAYIQAWQLQGKEYIRYINNLYDTIKSAAPTDAQKNFKYVFDLVFSLVKNINDILSQLPADSEYAVYLNASIASRLAASVQELSGDYVFFLQPGHVLDAIGMTSNDPLAPSDEIISVSSDPINFQAQFNFVNNNPWMLPAGVVIPSATLFAGDIINDIITNNFFTGAVSSFLNGIINIVNQTGIYLDKTLSNYPTHTPHYALYLSFLGLFKFAQDHLNEYTGRHLEFYYKKVLQLKNNLGIPDTAHLVFTLQKSIDQHLLSRGTLFKAGKDASNKDLFYSLTDDIVVNQASVVALKSLNLIKNYNNDSTPQQLFASPTANSADGQGAKLTSPDQSWFPFGDLSNDDFKSNNIASLGFAIASNILFLNEGTRAVTITFNCDPSSTSILSGLGDLSSVNIFSAKFTGNKKWFDASDYSSSGNNIIVNANAAANTFFITIILNGNAPPVIPYSQKIHGGNFTQILPMVQLTLEDYRYYSAIKLLKINSIDINADVDGVKNLALQNDAGTLDSSKPFKPFGDFPEDGAGFIIGSKEIFQKQLSDLMIKFIWQTSPDLSITNNIQAIALTAGEWNTGSVISPNVNSDLTSIDITVLQPPANNVPQSVPDFTANDKYSITSIDGFIKLLLSSSNYYSLSSYLNSIASATTQVVANVNGSETDYTVTPPSPPPTQHLIIAQSMSIHYSAKETIDLTSADANDFVKRTDFFYHIEPFGFREMHPYLLSIPGTIDTSLRDNVLHVLPVFDLDNDSQDSSDTGKISGHNNEGELWIGLSNTKPGEAQSILFQVSEGSSNPLKPITNINWFYMSSNNWILLDPATSVNDQTNSLSESGLVIFNLAGDETTNNTRADNNLLWIKAVVKNDTDAICRLIGVQANAAKAQFVTDIPDAIYFIKNIDANIISKPAIADAALKQTSQPYPSSAGSPKESNQQFDQRISERLRHKHRAVTAWDYERLVLQNFLQIHKAKCLNHTSLKTKTRFYSEMKPGDVMIVTVPDLSLVIGANPLLPFTTVGLLADIKKYIKPLCSPFVHVHVCNPQFEAVQFSFDVTFTNNNSNSGYYRQQLDTDIQQFLMPWAFGSIAADIEFGGKIEKSVVLNFVQSRPYVDFVTCFTMAQYIYNEDGTFNLFNSNLEEAIATTARSILVPYKDPKSIPGTLGNNISSPANCNCNA